MVGVLLGLGESLLAAILYDAGRGVCRGFNSMLEAALNDTSDHFQLSPHQSRLRSSHQGFYESLRENLVWKARRQPGCVRYGPTKVVP